MRERATPEHLKRLGWLLEAEAFAAGDARRGMRRVAAGGHEWPVTPVVRLVVGGVQIAREIDGLQHQLKRDLTLLSSTAVDWLARHCAQSNRDVPTRQPDTTDA